MKVFIRFIMGGIVGFISAYAILHFRDIHTSDLIFVFAGLALVTLLLICSIYLYASTKKLHGTSFTGEEEDEVDVQKYKKASDFSTSTHAALVLSIVLLAFTLIQEMSTYLIVISIILIVLSLIISTGMNPAYKFLYADRELPKADEAESSDDFADQILHATDEGERSVVLQGLYKSHNLMNILLIIAMLLATTYSIVQDPSQLFSVIMMGIVLIIGNVKYQLSIRNK